MLDRTQARFGLKPRRIAGDVAYGTGEALSRLVERGIEPHIPVKDMSRRDGGTFSREDFAFDDERDVYVCPQGKTLRTTGRMLSGNILYYRASKLDCERCPVKARCWLI